jgi:hypothetical protein
MTTYEVSDGTSWDTIEAANDDAAIEAAEAWLRDGDWPDEETVYLSAAVMRDGEEIGTVEVTLPPRAPACVRGHDHEWCRPVEVVGGLRENPGVHGSGGGVKVTEVCRHCGRRQHTDTWATDPRNGQQGVERVWYSEPDEGSLAWVAMQADDE